MCLDYVPQPSSREELYGFSEHFNIVNGILFVHHLFIITKADGDPQSCQQVSQMFDCFPNYLILTMFVF